MHELRNSIDILESCLADWGHGATMVYSIMTRIKKAVELLKEQHKKGHWAMNSNFPDRLICSECSSQFDVWHWESKQMHFCPNCGADMRKGR